MVREYVLLKGSLTIGTDLEYMGFLFHHEKCPADEVVCLSTAYLEAARHGGRVLGAQVTQAQPHLVLRRACNRIAQDTRWRES